EVALDRTARRVSVPVKSASVVAEVVRGLDDLGVTIVDVGMHRPSLDDAFLSLTGHDLSESDSTQQASGQSETGELIKR
nr:hypothetical protein [Micromonospora sp. DSM 115978]